MTHRPLRRILSQEVILVTLLPYLIVSALIFFWLLPKLRSDLESQQLLLAGQVSSQVKTYLSAAEGTVRGVAAIQLNDDLDWHNVQHVLDAQIEASTILRALYVVGKDGHIIVSGLAEKTRWQREDLNDFDLSRSDIFIQTEQLHRPVWSDAFLSAISGKVTAAIAFPSHDFTVIGEIDLDRLAQFLTNTAMQKDQLILIIDQRGHVVADQSGKLTAQQLNLNNIPLIKAGTDSSSMLSGQFKINNRSMYGTVSENKDIKWDILVGRPVDLLYRTSMITIIIFLSGLFVSLLLSSSASLYLARRLSLQFEVLANRARRLAQGEHVTEWPRGNINEIKELADDLSLMADAVTTRERQLSESERKIRAIFDRTFVFIGLLTPDGTLVEVNRTALDFVGVQLSDVLGKPFWETPWWSHSADLQDRLRAAVRQAAAGTAVQFETTHPAADGAIHIIEFSLKPVFDEDGRVDLLIPEGRDITELKRSEAVMQARLRLQKLSFTATMEELLTSTLDELEPLTGSTIGFYHFLAADQQTLILQSWSTNTLKRVCTAEGRGSHYAVSKAGVWADAVRERRQIIHNDYALLPDRKGMPDGHAAVTREVVVPIFRDNRIVAVIGVGNKAAPYTDKDIEMIAQIGDFSWDIVQQKSAARLAEQAEAQYRTILRTALDGFLVVDLKSRILEVNDAYCAMTGYSREELLNMSIADVEASHQPEEVARNIERIREEGHGRFESSHRHKDGSSVVLDISVNYSTDQGGRLICFLRDVTERKATEEARRNIEAKYRDIVENAPMGIFRRDLEGKFQYANPGLIRQLECKTEKELLDNYGSISQRWVCPERADEFNALLLKSRSINGYETETRLVDGTTKWFALYAFLDDSDQFINGFSLDITERKKVEAQLCKLSSAVEQSASTIVITDSKGTIEYVNPKFTEITGYTFEEAIWVNPRILKSSLTPPETYEHLWQEITSGRAWEGNFCNRKKSGELYWEHARIAPVTNALGDITHFVAVKEDITEKLRVDSELEHNLTKFQALYELSLLSEESEQVILDYCLEAAVRMTRSKIGYIYFMNEDETTLTLHAWSRDVMPACSIPFKPTVYRVEETGLWGEAARRRTPVITNDYEAPNPFKRGYPQGHVPISRHMNIPLIIHGKIVLLAGVGNKTEEYQNEDVTGLTLLMSGMWRMLETRKAEIALQESEERFRELFAQNYDAVIEFHPKRQRIINANQEALSLFGITLDEFRLLRPDTYIDRKDFRAFAKKLTQGKNPEGYTLTKATCYKKDGTAFSASIKFKRIKLTDEEIVLCSIRDITQKLLLEEEMRTTQAKLIQANKMTSLGMLVSSVAHEINNPNHCISVNTAVLKNIWGEVSPLLWSSAGTSGNALLGGLTRDEVQTHVPQLFSGIIESSQRINTIITNMREFVRGGGSSHPGSFDINNIIKSAVQILWHQINKHTDNFQCDLSEEIPLAYGNAQQIEQVLINLIINALQSLPKKAHGVRVTTEIDTKAGRIVIMVRDEGTGMSSETLQRLSEPFFTTRENEGGTGLGLYISTTIVKGYGGTVDFASELGKGTIATIRLPTVADS